MHVKEYKPQVIHDFRGQDYVQLKTVNGNVNSKRNFEVWRGQLMRNTTGMRLSIRMFIVYYFIFT